MDNLPFTPPQASTIAPQVDLLTIALIGLSGFFTSIVVLLIIYFSYRYRRGNNIDRSNPPITSMKMELSWVFLLLFLSMGAFIGAALVYFNMARPASQALEIYVVGQQWMWKFQHPDGPREIDELHVPRGQPVRLIMTSQDVIHSFYVPAFRLKYDVIPGRYTNLHFEATQTGEYHIFCTEYCGTGHSIMRGRVIVVEPREYQEWLAGGGPENTMVASGEQLFTQLGCVGCHRPDTAERAPILAGRFGQPVLLEGGETVIFDENYIRSSILFPQRHITAGYEPLMPSYEGRINEEQLVQLVAFIKGQPAGPAGPLEGQERIEPEQ